MWRSSAEFNTLIAERNRQIAEFRTVIEQTGRYLRYWSLPLDLCTKPDSLRLAQSGDAISSIKHSCAKIIVSVGCGMAMDSGIAVLCTHTLGVLVWEAVVVACVP